MKKILFSLIFLFFAAVEQSIADDEDYLLSIYGELPMHFAVNDPLEKINRQIFNFNLAFNNQIITRRKIDLLNPDMAKPSRRGKIKLALSNFLDNTYGPSNVINFALQKKPEESFRAFWRFAINSTLGFGGLLDVAKSFNLEQERAGFEQTLVKCGVGTGPYIVLPIIGSYSPRGIGADILEVVVNPLSFLLGSKLVVFAIHNYNVRSVYTDYYDLIFENNVDTYARIRSLYLQRTFD